MKLYVANPTNQNHRFHYREPARSQELMTPIPAGQQVQIGREMDEGAINHIVAQKEPYGMVHVEDMNDYPGRIALLYSLDTPVTEKQIVAVMKRNEGALIKEGQQHRQEAAIATANAMNTNTEGALKKLTVSVVEESKPGRSVSMGEEVITVHEPSEPSMRPRNKRKA